MRDLACPSVKLFAPATGAPGLGGAFGVFTAGVLASRLAGCATAAVEMVAAMTASGRMSRMFCFSSGGCDDDERRGNEIGSGSAMIAVAIGRAVVASSTGFAGLSRGVRFFSKQAERRPQSLW